MPKIKRIEPRTERFIQLHKHLKDAHQLPEAKELAAIMGYKTAASITEILGKRQNIKPEALDRFIEHFQANLPEELIDGEDTDFMIPLPKSLWVPYRSVDSLSLKHIYDVILPKDTFKSWDVQDNSMAPDMRRGDVIIAQIVDKNNWYNIGDYFVYLLVMDSTEIIGRIYKENESTWLLKRDNVAGVTIIYANAITELYFVRTIVRRTEAFPRLFDISEKRSELRLEDKK